MNCHAAQEAFSLYLYGELDFAREEQLETHLAQCAFCYLSLEREKKWHTLALAQVHEPPLDLLATCRQQLRPFLARAVSHPRSARSWWRWAANPFGISPTRWSYQIALASMLVFVGFASARWLDRHSFQSSSNEMSVLNFANSRIRDVQPGDAGSVRILLEQEREVRGPIDDAQVRGLLLAGTRQPDPSVRFNSFEILNRQPHATAQVANDLREVVFYSVRNDPNAAVRLQAIEALRRFDGDPASLETLKFVLEHDDDPSVRSQAIDMLAPKDVLGTVTPALAQAMEDIMRSSLDDEYVRTRCTQVLLEANRPVVY